MRSVAVITAVIINPDAHKIKGARIYLEYSHSCVRFPSHAQTHFLFGVQRAVSTVERPVFCPSNNSLTMSSHRKGKWLLCDVRLFPVDLSVSRNFLTLIQYIRPCQGLYVAPSIFSVKPGRNPSKNSPFLLLFYQLLTLQHRP